MTRLSEGNEVVRGADGGFPIVGVGASGATTDIVDALLRRLGCDGLAVVLLAPDGTDLAALTGVTKAHVVAVSGGERLARGTVYVVPAGNEVAVSGGVLALGARPKLPIDGTLRSLAADQGPLAIGVVLGGHGSDGLDGLRAIKDEGGITFVKAPSAFDGVAADFTLPPEEIADELARVTAHSYVERRRALGNFTTGALSRLFEQIRRSFGVDFSGYKLTTVERRIERRMVLHKIDKLPDYLRFLDGNQPELAALYDDLLIGVTCFFRDRKPFEILKTQVLARVVTGGDVPIRVWVPGCATGEEAYSIAMVLVELLEERGLTQRVQIFGTDIDDCALARARTGIYGAGIETDVSTERLQRFFLPHDKGYQVSRRLRDMVVFARHNLGKDPPFSRLDLVSCRNVLIYLQTQLQRKIFRLFHYALEADGALLLGTSESVGDSTDAFALEDRHFKIYSRKHLPLPAMFESRGRQQPPLAPAPAPPPDRRPSVTMQQLADIKVLEKYAPPGVLIDPALDVIQFRGQTGPYLGPAPGTATLNILKLIRPELLVGARAAIQKASQSGAPTTSEPVHVWTDRGSTMVMVEVLPLQEGDVPRRSLLVLFREQATTSATGTHPGLDLAGLDLAQLEPSVHDLERELMVTKEYLRSTVQELEASNEELQSSNEELQSSNEELQSTNEELETSKEELQSTNEELITVNEELSSRMSQLSVSNDDLHNLLSDVSAAVVIVGMDLRIRRFSVAAEALMRLIPGDVGRPVGYLGATLGSTQIESLVAETIKTVRPREVRVRCGDGVTYTLHSRPYRTVDHAIRGALLELIRVAPERGDVIDEANELIGRVVSAVTQVLVVLDAQRRIVWANRRFFEAFRVGTEVIGKNLEEVWSGRVANPRLWAMFDDVAMAPIGSAPLEVSGTLSTGGAAAFSVHRLAGEGERGGVLLLAIA